MFPLSRLGKTNTFASPPRGESLAFELATHPDGAATAAARADLGLSLARAAGGQGMVLGQALDIAAETAGRTLSLDEITALQANKTGALIQWTAEAGAILSQNDPKPLQAYANALGLAFQIADDLLDLLGEENQTGKSLGTDLEKQKATLPVIHALQAADPRHRDELLELLNNPMAANQPAILDFLNQYDAFDYARGKAMQFIEQARSELEVLPPSECRDVLADLTHFVISRSH